jgi:hypothetical protein
MFDSLLLLLLSLEMTNRAIKGKRLRAQNPMNGKKVGTITQLFHVFFSSPTPAAALLFFLFLLLLLAASKKRHYMQREAMMASYIL